MLTTAEAGLILTAQPIVMAIIAPISGTLSDRIGTRIPAVIGMVILSIGLFLLSRLGADSPNWQIVLSLGIMGLGTGIFISPNNSALMGSAPHNRQGIAAGILATARNFGMVLGVGISGAIFTTIVARGEASGAVGEAAKGIFINAIQASLLVAAGVAIIGAFTSAVRGASMD